MGLTSVAGIVTGPRGVARPVEFLVDSGAKYSVLPQEIWRALGLEPKRRMTFVLADGSRIERGG
jgi:predicted aspartyl protease